MTERNLKIQQAIDRMTAMGIESKLIEEFRVDQIPICVCDNQIRKATKEELNLIRPWQNEYQTLPYHLIWTDTTIGNMLSILYVSDQPEEWDMDMDDCKYMTPCAYVMNLSDPICSEFGSIGVQLMSGGLIRIA